MKDKNGVEIRTGDTVRINGAYFKNSNGLFAVTSCPGDPNWSGRDICLKRICKNGELSIRRDSVEFWPLSHYCSDSRKNAAAREHDRENATIEVVEIKDKSYISKYFREKADEIAQRAEYSAQRFGEQHSEAVRLREITEHYKKVVDRISGSLSEQQAEQQAEKIENQPPVKFYYNGIRVNGEKKLIRVFYSLDNNADHSPAVSISVRDYESLPREFFNVTNETDLYTDYFDSDRTELRPDHPLYKYARYAAERAKIKEKESRIKYLEDNIKARPAFYDRDYYKSELEQLREQVAELKAHKNPGQPKAEDIEKIKEMRLEEENRRKAEQQAEQQRQREQAIREQAKEKSHSDGYDLSSVTMAPWMPEYMETKKKENEEMMQVMRFLISTFSIEELVQAIKAAPEPEVATPFLLELVEKDIKKAVCMVEFLKEKFKGFTTDAAE